MLFKWKCQCPLRCESSWLEQALDKAEGDKGKKTCYGEPLPAILNLELGLMVSQFFQTNPELIQINCEISVDHRIKVFFCQNVYWKCL